MRAVSLVLVTAALLSGAAQATAADPLPALGADPGQTTVSGLSSGGFMAAQFHVAYSGSLIGAGVIAGGPYWCARNSLTIGMQSCMYNWSGPDVAPLVAKAESEAQAGTIDPLTNLQRQKIYLFHGAMDFTVFGGVVTSTRTFYTSSGISVPYANIKYNDGAVAAGHAFVTPDYGSNCAMTASPFINDCNFDQPGETLGWLYGTLQARVKTPAGTLTAFDQAPFLPGGVMHGMASVGYVYVPTACTGANAGCRVHVVFHGCTQNAETVKDAVYAHAGYNNWADNNRLIMLYPQTTTTQGVSGNNGCWDWWGYDSANYYTKAGPQMQAVYAMIQKLTATAAADPR